MSEELEQFIVIVENDESKWSDQTGIVYHYPRRYQKHLIPGATAIYYKGKLRNKKYENFRMSSEPHYFGIARIGKSFTDANSEKGDLFATIESYRPFKEAVIAKTGNEYLEEIPQSRASNYWRDGVRAIPKETFERIRQIAKIGEMDYLESTVQTLNDKEVLLESIKEGSPSQRYTTIYERSKVLREQAIAIHGKSCLACGFNFEYTYGSHGAGYIQIHHTNPVSKFDQPRAPDPALELIPLCANCHAMVHRRKDKTLSLTDLKEMIKQANVTVENNL